MAVVKLNNRGIGYRHRVSYPIYPEICPTCSPMKWDLYSLAWHILKRIAIWHTEIWCQLRFRQSDDIPAFSKSWWSHEMETFPPFGPLWSTGHSWIPLAKANDEEFDDLFDVFLNNQSKGRRIKMFRCSFDVAVMISLHSGDRMNTRATTVNQCHSGLR